MCLNVTWFAGILLFSANIDSRYFNTFYTLATAKTNCQRIFTDGKTDESRIMALEDNYFLWRDIEDDLEVFVKEGWEKWKDQSWFDEKVWLARLPKDFRVRCGLEMTSTTNTSFGSDIEDKASRDRVLSGRSLRLPPRSTILNRFVKSIPKIPTTLSSIDSERSRKWSVTGAFFRGESASSEREGP
mmetsp:Transcript_21947/g.45815  ORF Transcript_21947/g.45815 Transcript_21947/m.45815 type:complete len:186 (-) Transcript_21947:56-613(-)